MFFSKLPNELIFIINKLEKNEFEAFIVGGCVRDCLMHIKPKDWDICTNAKPLEIKNIFYDFKMDMSGVKYGTVAININNIVFEITTYRKELKYCNHRKPTKILFVDNLKEDLSRRDFTINAIAYNPNNGIVDFFNGINDLNSQLIRCINNPFDKIKQDALRIMRGIRFQSVYGLSIEEKTKKAIYQNSHLLKFLSSERICSEFLKILNGKYAQKSLSNFNLIFFKIIPELKYLKIPIKQNVKFSSLWELAVNTLSNCEHLISLRLAILFRHIGIHIKHNTLSICTNYEDKSIQIFNKISLNLKIPKKYIEQTSKIIKYQNIFTPLNINETCQILNKIDIKTYSLILKLKKAYLKTIGTPNTEIIIAENILNKVIQKDICYSHKKMKISGTDLIKLGYNQGPNIGKALNIILNKIIDGKLQNIKTDLIEFAKQIKSKYSK